MLHNVSMQWLLGLCWLGGHSKAWVTWHPGRWGGTSVEAPLGPCIPVLTERPGLHPYLPGCLDGAGWTSSTCGRSSAATAPSDWVLPYCQSGRRRHGCHWARCWNIRTPQFFRAQGMKAHMGNPWRSLEPTTYSRCGPRCGGCRGIPHDVMDWAAGACYWWRVVARRETELSRRAGVYNCKIDHANIMVGDGNIGPDGWRLPGCRGLSGRRHVTPVASLCVAQHEGCVPLWLIA